MLLNDKFIIYLLPKLFKKKSFEIALVIPEKKDTSISTMSCVISQLCLPLKVKTKEFSLYAMQITENKQLLEENYIVNYKNSGDDVTDKYE